MTTTDLVDLARELHRAHLEGLDVDKQRRRVLDMLRKQDAAVWAVLVGELAEQTYRHAGVRP